MTGYKTLLATGDATLTCYVRTFDQLRLELRLWDETARIVTAFGVVNLTDVGTWEVDGIVRVPNLDEEGHSIYGLVDTEGTLTLQFTGFRIEL